MTDRVMLVAPGIVGSKQTAQQMRALARTGCLHPAVRQLAVAITEPADARDYDDHALLLRRWLATHVKFTRDPPVAEMVQYPWDLVAQANTEGPVTGDCDCIATLAASLGCAVGMRFRFVLVGFPTTGVVDSQVPLTHVYTELLGRSGWKDMDVTRPAAAEPITVARRVIVSG
jgi:hypothetical protein